MKNRLRLTLRQQRGEVPRYVALSPEYEPLWARTLPLSEVSPLATDDGPVPVGTPLKPVRVELSPEATLAVLRYQQVTGDEPVDIASGVVTGLLEYALFNIARRHQAAWRRTAEDIAVATRQRIERNAGPQHDISGLTHTVLKMFEPAMHARLTAVTAENSLGSVETLIQRLCEFVYQEY